jgi:hypothetical protein
VQSDYVMELLGRERMAEYRRDAQRARLAALARRAGGPRGGPPARGHGRAGHGRRLGRAAA